MKDRQGNNLLYGDIVTLFPDPHYSHTYIKAIFIGAEEVRACFPKRYKLEYIPITTIGLNTLEESNSLNPGVFKKNGWYLNRASKLQVSKTLPTSLVGGELSLYQEMLPLL